MSKERASYYPQATSWAVEQHAALRSTLRLTRMFAIGALVIAILEALALLALAPLKSSSAVPILVDRQTGYVEVLNADGRRDIAPNDALTRAFIARYVTDREHFDLADVAAAYKRVSLWSAESARQEYVALMQPNNPNNPANAYPSTAVVEARIKSLSPIGHQKVLVRFETYRRDADGMAQKPQAWVSIVSYRFSDAPMTFEDRLINPLGFQVVRYRRDPETAPLSETAEEDQAQIP
ncbi:virB8 family protein [Caulobacter sp. RHG1]|jgi:type IV secretion system protein VirB8|uniref:virB8 family protein n=1 Tax=Caulobacter sp. (strain RHG1) TaxID=2545762 RepID=UPI0015525B9D|nr:type IV secretion system protein [Caulobacter sp. RHG1]NQE63593.1 Inner membrane protein forms channel for type IV secretion of T-DNA complex, VirB8 [Caulobacter sp. RHG1]